MFTSQIDLSRTIVAVASARGGAARGIVRLSGNDAVRLLSGLAATPVCAVGTPSRQRLLIRVAGFSASVPVSALVWPDRRSYTREPAVELHTWGSPPLLDAIVATLVDAGAALAAPGEFTLRAFLAGRLDLTQAEAVIGAVDAVSTREFSVSLVQAAGGLRDPLQQARGHLLDVLAQLEAGLDFADEDIEFITRVELEASLAQVASRLERLRDQIRGRAACEGPYRVVLTGRPNVGKSSLFNALLGRVAAIASDVPGTTRDYLSESLTVGGLTFRLFDSAGVEGEMARPLPKVDESHPSSLAPGSTEVASQAESAARRLVESADLRILCAECGAEPGDESAPRPAAERETLVVATKADRIGMRPPWAEYTTSAATGKGIDELRQAIAARLNNLAGASEVPQATAARCAIPVSRAIDALLNALAALRSGAGEELLAAELRVALDELGQVVGAVYTDDILDRIFSRFCIGK
jgi:tRNA modification GTPase